MASDQPVPDSVTPSNMTGVYSLNKRLSSPTDEVLKMQNVRWIIRQAIAWSNVTVKVHHYTDDSDPQNIYTQVDTEQSSTGGLRSSERRTADWTWRDKEDFVFGRLNARFRMTKLGEVEATKQEQVDDVEFLKQGWEGDEQQRLGTVMFESQTESMTDDWTAHQVWGFGFIDGVRRRLQRAVVRKPSGEVHQLVVVYDWVSEHPEDTD